MDFLKAMGEIFGALGKFLGTVVDNVISIGGIFLEYIQTGEGLGVAVVGALATVGLIKLVGHFIG